MNHNPTGDAEQDVFWRFRQWALVEKVEDFGRCVIPLYKSVGSIFHIAGSGILLRIADTRFLLMANHCFEEFTKENTIVMTSPNESGDLPFQINGCAPIRPSPNVEEHLDMVIIKLLPKTYEYLESGWRKFLCVRDLSLTQQLRQAFYVVVGYPTPERFSIGELDGVPLTVANRYAYMTTDFLKDAGRLENMKSEFNFALEYPAKTVQCDGTERPAIHPGGMSGGAIFQVSRDRRAYQESSAIKCVGMQVAFVPRSHLQGVYLVHAVKAIAKYYPELRKAISISLPFVQQ